MRRKKRENHTIANGIRVFADVVDESNLCKCVLACVLCGHKEQVFANSLQYFAIYYLEIVCLGLARLLASFIYSLLIATSSGKSQLEFGWLQYDELVLKQ